jgi:signal transduction histidine kinase
MFIALATCWMLGSVALVVFVVLARRRRGALARQLHELRGALTAARLAVDLVPVLSIDAPSACNAASDELERTYSTLGDFERLLHAGLVTPALRRRQVAMLPSPRRRQTKLDSHHELSRLALIWNEAARREHRELLFEWHGPTEAVLIPGPRRRFIEVVANLLENALRHGSGRISLVARVRCDSLRIEVIDQGPGLPQPLAAIVRSQRTGRHGHGLAIARAAAHALGGTLTSAPSGSGAKVAFTVPALHDPTTLSPTFGEPTLVGE